MNKSIWGKPMVVTIAGAIAGVALVGASNAWAQQGARSLREQMAGTWSLVAQYVERDGKKMERFGPDPKGIYIFERGGRFAAILMRSNLPKIASNNPMTATADENKAITQGSTAFFGSWSINEKDRTMISHIDASTFPNWDGQKQSRVVALSGEELTLCVPAQIAGSVACAVWKRVR